MPIQPIKHSIMNSKTISLLIAVLLFVAISSLLPSCGKEGPQGIPGPQGDSGVAGATGPAGADGSVIYSGNGAPASTIGQNGDYYLDKSTGNLYGPKTSSGWGTPLSLSSGQGGSGAQGPAGPQGPPGASGAQGPAGPQGAQGTPGSQFLSGSGAPAGTLGNIGDFYLDKTGYFLYGPKTANGWGTPTLLRGAQGPQGPAGPAGVAGSQIYSGTGAPAANLGIIGDYYIDKSTVNFYGPKTANGWGTPIALGGGSGSQGPAGPQGPPGAAGPQGPQGPPGATGPQGPQGGQGATGATGAAGAAGSQIFSGTTAPPAATGKTGDYYIDDMHAILYGPKTATGWPATGLSLQVNNTITYDFVDKVSHNLPYNWQPPAGVHTVFTGGTYSISLPYNNAAAQTTGFTIPQAIADNGIVLCYARYFLAPPSDTATDAGMTSWIQLPISINYFIAGAGIYPLSIETSFDDNAFNIGIYVQSGTIADDYVSNNNVAVIRIVLIPGSQINTIQNYNPNLRQSLPGQLLQMQ
jgi:hypothetical protein